MMEEKKVMLEGEELSEAHLKNDSEVQKEQEALEKLKKLRGEMTELSNKMGEAQDPEEYHKLKSALQSVEKNYKMERYKDHRIYSETTQKWRDNFLLFLEARENFNPKRTSNMAMDILLPYEHSLNRPLQFTDILNVRTVREMLCNIKESTKLTPTTKLKYLSVFELFV